MLCPNCSTGNVLLEDGQFFCSECESQQLAAREEAIIEENLYITKRNVVGSTKSDESSLNASVSSTESNTGSIYECYNILLHKQVMALINLGVSEKLKGIVLFLWTKYLQKCEAAFMEENAADQEKLKEDESNNIGIQQSVKKRRTKKKNKDANELSSDSDAGVSKKDFMEVDEPSRAAFFSQSKNFWTHYEFGDKVNRVDKMCISKTLCFCYLGILYIQDRLLLTDLLRLVKEGRVPFLNATNYIPHSMLCALSFSSKLFNEKCVPDVKDIASMSSQLIHFLQLPKWKHRSLISIALNFVKDLNLPDNIIHIVKMLVDKCNDRTKDWKAEKSCIVHLVPMYEVQAIALIIVALKMFYVLDGEYEVNHCDISRKINIILQDRRLFVWDQWKKQASLKEYLFFTPNNRCTKISLFDSLSASHIISKYSATPSYVPNVHKDFRLQERINSAKQNILNVFNSLRSGSKSVPETPAPTSFPLTRKLSDFMKNWKNLHMYEETKEIDFSLLTENFSSDILFYKPSSNEDESSKEIIELLCDSLYKPIPYRDGTLPDAFQTSSGYWEKVPPNSNGICLKDLPPSFQWLLKFMSKYIDTDCQIVYTEVLRLERKILPPRHRMREIT